MTHDVSSSSTAEFVGTTIDIEYLYYSTTVLLLLVELYVVKIQRHTHEKIKFDVHLADDWLSRSILVFHHAVSRFPADMAWNIRMSFKRIQSCESSMVGVEIIWELEFSSVYKQGPTNVETSTSNCMSSACLYGMCVSVTHYLSPFVRLCSQNLWLTNISSSFEQEQIWNEKNEFRRPWKS